MTQHPHVLHCADNKSVRHLFGPLNVSNYVWIQLLVGDDWRPLFPFDLFTYIHHLSYVFNVNFFEEIAL
jgi:hypothetical protein